MTQRPDMDPPRADEYDAYYAPYVEALPETKPILEILTDQRDEILALLDGLGEERASFRYASGKWSIKEVVGHLIDTERVFAYRALCFARGEEQAQPGMDQDAYVTSGEFDARPLQTLVSEYRAVRESTLALFSSLSTRQLLRRGTASGCAFSARAIAFVVGGHERHHLEVLRSRYGLEPLS